VRKEGLEPSTSQDGDHSQLSDTPFSGTIFMTRLGMSVEKVVATIETPTSHHGAARPDVKNSAVLFPARFAKKIAGRKDTTTDAPMMLQSKRVRCIRGPPRAAISE
jgi:hypothetical protein